MSYSSRVYRQRNAHAHDKEKNNDGFFGKQADDHQSKTAGSFFQAKLSVNQPGDAHEKEADAVANAVVNNKSEKPVTQRKQISSIQRLATPAEEEKLGTNDSRMKMDKDIQEKPLQRAESPEKEKEKKPVQKAGDPEKEKEKKPVQKAGDPVKEKEKKPVQKAGDPEKEKDKKPVQAKQESGSGVTSPQLSSKIEGSAGKGNTLPPETLKEMNTSFGHDFSDVSIHKDSESAGLNKELDAQAFTHGKDIYFNEGKYNPDSAAGKNLLAHELTHVVQQNKK